MSRLLRSMSVLLALSACPTPMITPQPDAGPEVFVGRACNVDAECGSLRCDKVRRQCICLSDMSCLSSDPFVPPQYCNNYTGLCVTEITGCKADADCQLTEFCDPALRACRPLKNFCEVCTRDTECGGAGDNCVPDTSLGVSFCGKACGLDSDCPRGAGCVAKSTVKQCWPTTAALPGQAPSCKNFKGCTPDSLRTCNTTADCGDLSQRCDPAKGKCVAIEQTCVYGTTCDPRAKICVADCTVDADCGDVKLRCTNKVCEPIGDCTTDAQCAANQICNIPPGAGQGQCGPFCQQDADCPIGNTCQKVAGDKYRCQPGCTANAGCPLDQRCNQATKLCEGPTVGSARVCQTTSACHTCELCSKTAFECQPAKSTFPHCLPCNSSVDCSGGTCVNLDDGRFCAQSCGITGTDCPQGFVCLSTGTGQNVCVPSSRTCTGKCP